MLKSFWNPFFSKDQKSDSSNGIMTTSKMSTLSTVSSKSKSLPHPVSRASVAPRKTVIPLGGAMRSSFSHHGPQCPCCSGFRAFTTATTAPLRTMPASPPQEEEVNYGDKRIPAKHWQSVGNQRHFLDWLGGQLNVKDLDGWYKVSASEIKKRGGSGLLTHYGGSVSRALKAVYPEHQWQFWKFSTVPAGEWDEISNQRLYMDWYAKEYGVKTPLDWFKVSASEVYRRQGRGLLAIYDDSMVKAGQSVYPEYQNLEEVKNRPSYYFINRGKPLGHLPTCRGCKEEIPRQQLRIQVPGTFEPLNSEPRPQTFNFHLNADCVEKAMKSDVKNFQVAYPPYEGVVYLAPELEKDTTKPPGINFISGHAPKLFDDQPFS